MDVIPKQSWVSTPLIRQDRITYLSKPASKPVQVQETYILGVYFFFSDTKVDHTKSIFNIFDLLSKFGGLYGSIFRLLGVIGGFYNSRLFIADLIKKMYFIKLSSEGSSKDSKAFQAKTQSATSNSFTKIKFNSKDIFSHIKALFCIVFCRKNPLNRS